jgi:glutamate-1-semialdehyde 2,1-aminomutase
VIGLPTPWGRYFVSFAHGDEELAITLNAYKAAAREVAQAKVV